MSRTDKIDAAGRQMSRAQTLALWADRLRDIAASGLTFSDNIHDRANYETVQQIAMAMLALATDEPLETMEPLRAPRFNRPTPLTTGDAAIINSSGEILLIQRADNRLWAMPGGALNVGETPAEGTVREALEETGVHCLPVELVGIYDSRLRGTVSRHHLFQFVFLCRPENGGEPVQSASHALEVLAASWFSRRRLPEELDPGHTRPIHHAFDVWQGDRLPFFDGRPDLPK